MLYLSCDIGLFTVVSKFLPKYYLLFEFFLLFFFSPGKTMLKKHQHTFLCAFPYIRGVVAALESQGCLSPFFILVGCSMVFAYTEESTCCLCSPAFPILRTFLLYFRSTMFFFLSGLWVILLPFSTWSIYYCEELERGKGDLGCGMVLYGEKNMIYGGLCCWGNCPLLCAVVRIS